MTIPTRQTKPNGLHQKYDLRKIDGRAVDPEAEYFVLRLDDAGEPNHVAACKAAILKYAEEIDPHLPELAADLRQRYGGN